MAIAHGCDTYTVFIEINRLGGVLADFQQELEDNGRVSSHISVQAGDIIGEHGEGFLDFQVNDGNIWLPGYVAPFGYVGEGWKPYTVDPLDYFTPALATAFEATLPREDEPRWGIIDHDVAGTAAGNWYVSGTLGYSGVSVEDFSTATAELPNASLAGKLTYAWSHLAIAEHWIYPQNWVFSIGWWEDEAGDTGRFCIDLTDGNPAPSALTPEHGTVVYVLRKLLNARDVTPDDGNLCDGIIRGIVAMQVNGDETLFVEPIPGVESTADFEDFSADMRTYRR